MTNSLIGLRLKALREKRNIDQGELARVLGLQNRQTISAIENGERRVKPAELALLIDQFKLDPDYFTDPFRLVGEGAFCWRQSKCSTSALNAYQDHAGRWLATYRSLTEAGDRPGPRERRSLRLWEHSSYEVAEAEGERFALEFDMGAKPALKLPHVMENEFGILVLMVDMDSGISGAACRLPELDAVLVNRREPVGRRNFDLAHEFFHLLTWDTMPPKEIEAANDTGGNRMEQLANKFAAALLMPRRLLERFGEWTRLGDAERANRMREVADHFQVSVSALHWRLVALKLLNKSALMVEVLPSADEDSPPALFSRNFLTVIAAGIDLGRLSASKAARLLSLSREALRGAFADHGVQAPVTV